MTVNLIIPARRSYLPISQENPAIKPVASIPDVTSEFGDAARKQPSNYVYRGEVIEAGVNDKRYRPQYNFQTRPENIHAINAYQKTAINREAVGQILDGYI
jgi:hypothetical protein